MAPIKLSRGSMRSWTIGKIKQQGGICPICKKEIDLKIMGNKSDYFSKVSSVLSVFRTTNFDN